MIDVDLKSMKKYLNPPKAKLTRKEIRSVE